MDLEELKEGCLHGDRKSQHALYEKYADKLYSVCLSYVKNKEIAQDILHNSFLKAFKKFYQYDFQRSLEAWLHTIIVNASIDYIRKATKFRNVDLEEKFTVNNNNVFEYSDLRDINQFVEMLPVGARTIFNLYVLEGYNHKEIAKKLCISEGTSKSQFSRARGLLKTMINKYYVK